MKKKDFIAVYDEGLNVKSSQQKILSAIIFLSGVALCFTGIGAFIGIPMIIISLLADFKKTGGWKGECPYCFQENALVLPELYQGEADMVCPKCMNTSQLKRKIVKRVVERDEIVSEQASYKGEHNHSTKELRDLEDSLNEFKKKL